jgi:hypothetical protein
MRLRGHRPVWADELTSLPPSNRHPQNASAGPIASARTWASSRTHAFPPSPSLSLPPLPSPTPSLADAVCCPRVRWAASVRTREKNKNKNKIIFIFNFFWVVVAGFEREKFIIFGFRFSIPKLPKLPELRGLHEWSREKKKVFSA